MSEQNNFPARILVVDDEPDLAILMRQRFRQKIRENIYDFDFAYNGVEALDKIKSGNVYNLIMTDINMPEMDGLTLLTEIRKYNRHLKTLVVSAYSDMQNIRTAMNRGAFDFITKPIDFADLEATFLKTIEEDFIIRQGLNARESLELAEKDREQALRSAHFKQQFLANMSHEIRTPLNAVVGLTNLLLDKSPREDQLKYLRSMQQASRNLLSVINDILDISKIEAGKIQVEEISYSPEELLENVYHTLQYLAEEKGIDFRIQSDIKEWQSGDPVRITQVLTNLAGNAIKFTPESGRVHMRCFFADGSEHKFIRFEVEDNGIGIEADQLDRIFENFTQASNDTTRRYGGTGLGLSISRQLVELMHGKINVESRFGRGTKFYFDLPYRPAGTPGQTETTVESGLPERALEFLLAEDQPMNQMVASDTLESLFPGSRITIVANGKEAVDSVKSRQFDIIFMDLHMPVMDGFEATLHMRKELGITTPIVALTANVIREEITRCLEAGMDRHLAKPFEPGLLRKTVLELIKD